jgi:hypothetical protein
MQTNLAAGGAMLLTAIAMFVLGHKIEGNLSSMAPILVSRLIMVLLIRRMWIVRNYLAENNRKIKP